MTRHDTTQARPAYLLGIAIGIALLMTWPAHAHEGHDHGQEEQAPAVANGTAPRRLPDGGLWVPKPVQHRLNVRTLHAQAGEHAQALSLNGRVVADPNAGGKVQAPQAGRIEAGPQGLPLPGSKVAKGQVLAWLHPTANSVDLGNQLAALAELDAQYATAQRRLVRYEQLEGAIPRKDIEAARDERDALKKRRAAIAASVGAPEPIRAPVAGTIASSALGIGQIVDARETLFEVVDTGRLMVEAVAYDAAAAQGIREASATLPDGRTLALHFAGGGLKLQDQALPLLFRIAQPGTVLAIGQPLKVTASTARTAKGVAVPRSALVRNAAGETIVWLHTAPEQFTPRPVRHQPLEAQRVLVTEGLRGGERVVTEGASLLAQIR